MTSVQNAKEKLRELFENMDFSLLMPIFNNANLDQKEKSKIIEELNNQIFNKLNAACPYCCWHQEFAPGSVWLNGKEEIVDDRVDIFGCCPFFRVVIEIDATRADQVAKKALSRIAYFGADAIKVLRAQMLRNVRNTSKLSNIHLRLSILIRNSWVLSLISLNIVYVFLISPTFWDKA